MVANSRCEYRFHMWQSRLEIKDEVTIRNCIFEFDKSPSSSSKSPYCNYNLPAKNFSSRRLCLLSCDPEIMSQRSSLALAAVKWCRSLSIDLKGLVM